MGSNGGRHLGTGSATCGETCTTRDQWRTVRRFRGKIVCFSPQKCKILQVLKDFSVVYTFLHLSKTSMNKGMCSIIADEALNDGNMRLNHRSVDHYW